MNDSRLKPVVGYLRDLARPRQTADSSDRHLLHRFVTLRDEEAFTVIVQRHGPMVFGVCRRVLRQFHNAEDAFQATFLVLARKADSITRANSLGAWLYGVAYRISLRARTSVGRLEQREKSRPLIDVAAPPADSERAEQQQAVDDEI